MKYLVFVMGIAFSFSALGALQELSSTSDFERLVQDSDTPVVVQFSAYWCGPCKSLSSTLKSVASGYSSSQVQIAKVDAYVNSSLKNYLKGGYPTVRVFYQGQVSPLKYFTGSQDSSYIRNFIDDVISSGYRRHVPGPMCALEDE